MRSVAPALVGLALATAAGGAAARGLDFAQVEASSDSATLVLVRALGELPAAAAAPLMWLPPLLSLSATRWHDGEAVSLGVVSRWTLASHAGHTWRAGAGGGVDHFGARAGSDKRTRDGASLRAQLDADGPLPGADGWRYYALAQAATFRRQWFVSGQLGAPAGGIEWSRYGDDSYQSTTGVLRVSLDRVVGAPGWSLRLGAVHDRAGTRAVVGVGYNGF
ncbi:MAG: hypothetical protein ABI696_11040 [Rubrivivax sp.]